MRRVAAALVCLIPLCDPAAAIVGDASPADRIVARHAVMVYSARGTCTGTVLAPDLVLTAAHCVTDPVKMKIGGNHAGRMSHLADVAESALHPEYKPAAQDFDLALLKLSKPLWTHVPAYYGLRSLNIGDRLTVVGYGTTTAGERKIDGAPRMAMLIVTHQSARMIWLTDRGGFGERVKNSGCGGDSGAPIFAGRGGVPTLVAVLRGGPADCDSITVATPLAPHHDWIVETARKLGSSLAP